MEYTEANDSDYDMGHFGTFELEGLTFVGTCIACPEQYDVFLEGKIVCYIRLRHGQLRAYYPDVGGEVIYAHHFEDEWLGEFPTDEDRLLHLTGIAEKVYEKITLED